MTEVIVFACTLCNSIFNVWGTLHNKNWYVIPLDDKQSSNNPSQDQWVHFYLFIWPPLQPVPHPPPRPFVCCAPLSGLTWLDGGMMSRHCLPLRIYTRKSLCTRLTKWSLPDYTCLNGDQHFVSTLFEPHLRSSVKWYNGSLIRERPPYEAGYCSGTALHSYSRGDQLVDDEFERIWKEMIVF